MVCKIALPSYDHARVEIYRELAYIPDGGGRWVCGRIGCASCRGIPDRRGEVGRRGCSLPYPSVEPALAACEEEEAET
jgi:hypothetical protein